MPDDPRLVEILTEARDLGFLGPGPVDAHIEHARGFARAWNGTPPARFVDLGSGGGVPGLVLAMVWPTAAGVLLDANDRRTEFLARAAARLAPGRVVVRRDRAESAGRDPTLRGAADLVVARGFGPPAVTAECGAPLLAVGGRLIVSEPPGAPARWPSAPLAQLGLEPTGVVLAGAGYAVLAQRSPCPDRFPRRIGVPTKRPLF